MQIIEILKNRHTVLGQNSRNLDYIKEYGNKSGRRIADDKLLSKKVLIKSGIPVPELIGIIKNYQDLSKFAWSKLPKSFVMKPVHGSQGGGIEIFYNKDEEGSWIRSDKTKVTQDNLVSASRDILDGKYSLHNEADQIFFEERIKSHPILKNYCYKGVPDIRVVIFNKIPVMAYVRFPTKESKGKANMILGAVGTGIDIATGVTTTSTYGKSNNGKGEPIEFVPGTRLRYQGLKIPYWDKILTYALQTQQVVGLDFLAIDFLIDEKKGPVVVEINARPGLSIQIVNRAGLAWRLNKATGVKVKSLSHGIRLGKDLFGGEIEEQIEKISGKEIISNVVALKLFNDKYSTEALALVDTSRRSSIIEQETAKKLKLIPESMILESDEYIPTLVKLKLGNNDIESEARIVGSTIKGYKVILGRNDLKGYIIDIKKSELPSEKEKIINIISSKPFATVEQLDKLIEDVRKKVVLLPSIRPINLTEEKEKFLGSNYKNNPIFFYRPLRFNPDSILDKLEQVRPPEDPVGNLYREKISEYKKIISLINDIGNDPESFTEGSLQLYGAIDEPDALKAKQVIEKYIEQINPLQSKTYIGIDNVINQIQTVLNQYNIKSDIIITDFPGRTKMSVSVSKGKIFINKNYKWTHDRLTGSIAHEILTHLVRLNYSKKQKYKILTYGSSHYYKTEEGLATIMKYTTRINTLMYTPALNYYAIYLALNSDFKTTFHKLLEYLKPNDAWNFTYRVKRGIKFTESKGAFTKDQYFVWAIELTKAILRDPQALHYIFNGKGNIEELKMLTEPNQELVFNNLNESMLRKLLQDNLY